MTTIDLADVTYVAAEAGGGSPVLFLHGFTGSRADWTGFMASVARSNLAIAVDLLGHGASSKPTDPARYGLDHQARDLADLIERVGRGPTVVVAYSYGARIALRLAVDHPGLVSGLLLESPSAGIADPVDRAARHSADSALADDLERDGIARFVERWAAQPVFATERRLPDEARREIERRRRANDPAALAAALRGAGQGAMTPLHDLLPTIDAPTAVLAGALDATGLARARIVAAGIPGATLDVLDGVGHAPHREDPDRFTAWLESSIDRVTGSPLATAFPSPALAPSSHRRSSP